MKKKTTNKLNMYQSVHAVLNNYQTVWEGVPALVDAVSNFSNKLSLLSDRLVEQSSVTTGVSVEKQLRKNELRKKMVIVERALMLYGRATGNVLLEKRNSRSRSQLVALNDTKLAIRCSELKADLNAFGNQLGDYGVGATILEIMPLLLAVDELKNSTRQAILTRKGATDSIHGLEHEIDELLHIELDSLVLVFEQTQPAFFNAFRNARVIVDHFGHGSTPPTQPDDGGADV